MTTTNTTDFRTHVKKYLDAVEHVETVRLMRHGHVIAELVPPHSIRKIPSWKRPVKRLLIPGVTLSKEIIRDRQRGR